MQRCMFTSYFSETTGFEIYDYALHDHSETRKNSATELYKKLNCASEINLILKFNFLQKFR